MTAQMAMAMMSRLVPLAPVDPGVLQRPEIIHNGRALPLSHQSSPGSPGAFDMATGQRLAWTGRSTQTMADLDLPWVRGRLLSVFTIFMFNYLWLFLRL